MAPHSSTFAWKIPWTEKPGRLQSMGSLESDMTEQLHFHFSLSCIGEGNGNPLQCSCLENPGDKEAWWAAVCGVTQSRTRLKRLSSSSVCQLPGIERWIINELQLYGLLLQLGREMNKQDQAGPAGCQADSRCLLCRCLGRTGGRERGLYLSRHVCFQSPKDIICIHSLNNLSHSCGFKYCVLFSNR